MTNNTRTPQQQIADTIVAQTGGFSRLKTMIGAHTFILKEHSEAHEGGVGIMFRNRRMNYVEVLLAWDDTYTMRFNRVAATKTGSGITTLAEFPGLYNDQLTETFESTTGMRLNL